MKHRAVNSKTTPPKRIRHQKCRRCSIWQAKSVFSPVAPANGRETGQPRQCLQGGNGAQKSRHCQHQRNTQQGFRLELL
uniref:Uncharacterized protein n=1 Tax=Arundo donax TaxID=35708 RepID=A0A0A9BWD9_ARUDO